MISADSAIADAYKNANFLSSSEKFLGPLERPLVVSLFTDRFGQDIAQRKKSLKELCTMLRSSSPKEKKKLPLIKLGEFGDKKSARDSYRHDENIRSISGIECDYDGEVIAFEQAVETLRRSKVAAMVYTSPSHSPQKPRWRVLAPCSADLSPDERSALVGRINGLWGGVLGRENFAKSQAFYFGFGIECTDCRAELIDGRFIDQCNELDTSAAMKTKTKASPAKDYIASDNPIEASDADYAALAGGCGKIRNAKDGEKHHVVYRVAYTIGGMVGAFRIGEREAWETLSEALEGIKDRCDDFGAAQNTLREGFERGLQYPLYPEPTDAADLFEAITDTLLGEKEIPVEENGESAPEDTDDAELVSWSAKITTAGGYAAYSLLKEFNQKYAVVRIGDKVAVLVPSVSDIEGRRSFDFMHFADFRNMYINRIIKIESSSGTDSYKTAGDFWLESPERLQYLGGIIFDPSGKQTGDVLNLWQGWAYEPRPGDWSLLRAHIFNNICGSNQEYFDYLMGWMARLFQYPAKQGEVAVVLRGEEGNGKGTLANILMKISGQHGYAAKDARHLTGNFNAHLRDVVFLFADEALYAGDPSQQASLKALITEPIISIEAKFRNAQQAMNRLHIMMASNNEWVVPASLESRRFFVLDVGNDHQQDIPYFGEIFTQMDNGGYSAMLHDLLHLDISSFDVRKFPVTQGLIAQRILSLKTHEKWLYESLHRGYFAGDEWQTWVPTGQLYRSYLAFADEQGDRYRRQPESQIGTMIAKAGFKATRPRRDPHTGCQYEEAKRPRGYLLGSLEDARAAYVKATGLDVEWPTDGHDEFDGKSDRAYETWASSVVPFAA